jgi:RNA polymerase sigma-70 factor (ECF subfamily)
MIGGIGATARAATAERSLVERARAGDADAFDLLVRDRIDAAYRLASTILGPQADARDVVQDAFLHAWRELPRLRDPERFDAWFGRILVNGCRTAMRRRKVTEVREIRPTPVEDGELDTMAMLAAPGGDSPGERIPEADAIRRAFARLKEDARSILVLHHVAELPVAEIAATLGIPVGTAKWRLHDARSRLERALAEERR